MGTSTSSRGRQPFMLMIQGDGHSQQRDTHSHTLTPAPLDTRQVSGTGPGSHCPQSLQGGASTAVLIPTRPPSAQGAHGPSWTSWSLRGVGWGGEQCSRVVVVVAEVAGEEVEGAPWAPVGQGWAGNPQRVRTSGGCRGNQGRVFAYWHLTPGQESGLPHLPGCTAVRSSAHPGSPYHKGSPW